MRITAFFIQNNTSKLVVVKGFNICYNVSTIEIFGGNYMQDKV